VTTLRGEAENVLSNVEADPSAACSVGLKIASLALAACDNLAAAAALRAVGVATRLLGQPRDALAYFAQAADLCVGDDRLHALVRVSRAASLQQVGKIDEGLHEIDESRDHLTGGDRAFADYQRATLLARAGRMDEAGVGFDGAIVALEASGETRYLAGALTNRGLMRCYGHDLDKAVADLQRARRLYLELGLRGYAATALHNLGYGEARRGRLASALDLYDAARVELAAAGTPTAGLAVEHAEVLTEAGLFVEARMQLQDALVGLTANGNEVDRAESHLALAELELLCDRTASAQRHAKQAHALFTHQARNAWADRASLIVHEAEGTRSPNLIDPLIASVTDAGLTEAAWRGRLFVIGDDDTGVTNEALMSLLSETREAPAWLRFGIHDRLGHALARTGDVEGERHASDTAMSEVLTKIHGSPLALAAPLTFHARRVFARHRSLAFRSSNVERLHQSFEQTVAITMSPGSADKTQSAGSCQTVLDVLDGRAAIEFAEIDARLVAIVFHAGTTQVVDVGDFAANVEVAASASAMASILSRPADHNGLQVHALGAMRSSVESLDDAWRSWWPDASSYAVSMSPELMCLPLPVTRLVNSRPLTYTSSLSRWVVLQAAPASGVNQWRALHGPNLQQGARECGSLAGLGCVTTENNRVATSSDLTEALASGDGLHLVAHGRTRSGNPLLSSLVLGDGPFYLDRLLSLGRVSSDIVLSVCNGGDALAVGAGESLGVASMLLRCGASRVVASWAPTPDTPETVAFMTRLHSALARMGAPEALAQAAQDFAWDDPNSVCLAVSFACFSA
jgi:tetratricopeptide (TPR) repeat protein